MPVLDVVDETFVFAPVTDLLGELCDEATWQRHGLTLTCYDDRGVLGKRWTVGHPLAGTAEIWLEQVLGGVIVHLYVRVDPGARLGRRASSRVALERRYARPLKQWVLQVKRRYDSRRPAGTVTDSMTHTGSEPPAQPEEQ